MPLMNFEKEDEDPENRIQTEAYMNKMTEFNESLCRDCVYFFYIINELIECQVFTRCIITIRSKIHGNVQFEENIRR